MALIMCPECGKDVSDKAHVCPNCGFPIAMEKNAKIETNLSREDLIQIASSEIERKQFNEAIKSLSMIMDPDAEVFELLADAYFCDGEELHCDFDKSIEYYQKAIDYLKCSQVISIELMCLYLKIGFAYSTRARDVFDMEMAVSFAARVAEIDSENEQAKANLASVYWQYCQKMLNRELEVYDLDLAKEYLDIATEYATSSEEILSAIAESYSNLSYAYSKHENRKPDLSDEMECSQKALSLAPNDKDYKKSLKLIYNLNAMNYFVGNGVEVDLLKSKHYFKKTLEFDKNNQEIIRRIILINNYLGIVCCPRCGSENVKHKSTPKKQRNQSFSYSITRTIANIVSDSLTNAQKSETIEDFYVCEDCGFEVRQ
ncbi:MAG: hypothetical protein A2Y20_11190 [Firmicutes bacterium GWF2_51_9]|nr:MAG: hypothetical protein A2Y20_11190 [Firmicutes bacterium GWF2_51_9]